MDDTPQVPTNEQIAAWRANIESIPNGRGGNPRFYALIARIEQDGDIIKRCVPWLKGVLRKANGGPRPSYGADAEFDRTDWSLRALLADIDRLGSRGAIPEGRLSEDSGVRQKPESTPGSAPHGADLDTATGEGRRRATSAIPLTTTNR